MAWLQVHQTLKDHRKLFDAADQLEVEPPHMMGLLVSFWLWALDNAPDRQPRRHHAAHDLAGRSVGRRPRKAGENADPGGLDRRKKRTGRSRSTTGTSTPAS